MAKALCIAGMVVAALQVLVFGVDISVHFPFNAPSWWMDVFPIVCVDSGVSQLGDVARTDVSEIAILPAVKNYTNRAVLRRLPSFQTAWSVKSSPMGPPRSEGVGNLLAGENSVPGRGASGALCFTPGLIQ